MAARGSATSSGPDFPLPGSDPKKIRQTEERCPEAVTAAKGKRFNTSWYISTMECDFISSGVR